MSTLTPLGETWNLRAKSRAVAFALEYSFLPIEPERSITERQMSHTLLKNKERRRRTDDDIGLLLRALADTVGRLREGRVAEGGRDNRSKGVVGAIAPSGTANTAVLCKPHSSDVGARVDGEVMEAIIFVYNKKVRGSREGRQWKRGPSGPRA